MADVDLADLVLHLGGERLLLRGAEPESAEINAVPQLGGLGLVDQLRLDDWTGLLAACWRGRSAAPSSAGQIP